MKSQTQLVLFTQPLLTSITLGVLAGIGVMSSVLPQPVLAEAGYSQPTGYDQPLQGLQNQQPSQNLSPTNNGDFNLFQLIHNAQLGNIRNNNEFSTDQGRNLDSAAAKFRMQQLQLIRPQNQATPITPVTPSPSVKN